MMTFPGWLSKESGSDSDCGNRDNISLPLKSTARNHSKNQQLSSKTSALTGGHWRIRCPKNENRYFGDCR